LRVCSIIDTTIKNSQNVLDALWLIPKPDKPEPKREKSINFTRKNDGL
jgi:hypothetical protein